MFGCYDVRVLWCLGVWVFRCLVVCFFLMSGGFGGWVFGCLGGCMLGCLNVWLFEYLGVSLFCVLRGTLNLSMLADSSTNTQKSKYIPKITLEMSCVTGHLSCVTCHQHIVFCHERHLDSEYSIL